MGSPYEWWQWLLYFYVYSFAGWIWECCYVSVNTHKWVNRGFLHLPMLPLYGSGAVTILYVTYPFRDNVILLFLAGMVGATCLECATGLSMEALYKVKYWDYSDKKLNFRGVICLEASLLWGVFSLAMVKLVHAPVEGLLGQLPVSLILGAEGIISVMFAYDFYVSNRDALQLARVITAMEKARQEMQENLELLELELEEQRRILEDNLEKAREKAEDCVIETLLSAMEVTDSIRKKAQEQRDRMRDTRELQISEARNRLEEMRRLTEHRVENVQLNILFQNQELIEKAREQREQYMKKQEERLASMEALSRSILLRNPSARLSVHSEMSTLLRRKAEFWMEQKKDQYKNELY